MNYYLGVKSLANAADAINELFFMKVLDISTFQVQIKNIDHIKMSVGPASSDNDMSKGVMLYIGGKFTPEEMAEISKMSRHSDKFVTEMVSVFVAGQSVMMQNKGISAAHTILGQ